MAATTARRGLSAFLGRDARHAAAIFTLAALLVFSSVELAIGLRAHGMGPPLPGAPSLDYAAMPHPLAPLGTRFIESVLGDEPPVLPDRTRRGSVEEGSGASIIAAGPFSQDERVVVTHPLTNDDREDARVIPSIPFTATTSDSDATRQSSDPNDCASVGGTIWYRFTPDRNVGLVAFTYGTDHTVALGVFKDDGGLRKIGCDTDPRGNALFAFPAEAGRTYLLQLTAPGQTGELVLHLEAHGDFELISRGRGGKPANAGISWGTAAMSADGRYVVWSSRATNLVAGTDDRPCMERHPRIYSSEEPCSQIYVRDLRTKRTEIVSITRKGRSGDGESADVFISADGRYVAFASTAPNLSREDHPELPDIFVHDRRTRRTEWIATSADTYPSSHPSLSDDGRYVAFSSTYPLVPEDTNGLHDVYVFDRNKDRYELVTVSFDGRASEYSDPRSRRPIEPCLGNVSAVEDVPGLGALDFSDLNPYISGDGRWVVFRSDATNLVADDHNGEWDAFVRDRIKDRTERVSVSSSGAEGDGSTFFGPYASPQISAGGRYVVFSSCASNISRADDDELLDAYWHDRWTGRTKLLSGVVEGDLAGWPSISRDGRYVAFDSQPSDAENDSLYSEVYRHDTLTGATSFVTLTPFGSDSSGWGSTISADGSAVLFVSKDPKLARTKGFVNVFLYMVPRGL